jgi:hypothetical protein
MGYAKNNHNLTSQYNNILVCKYCTSFAAYLMRFGMVERVMHLWLLKHQKLLTIDPSDVMEAFRVERRLKKLSCNKKFVTKLWTFCKVQDYYSTLLSLTMSGIAIAVLECH